MTFRQALIPTFFFVFFFIIGSIPEEKRAYKAPKRLSGAERALLHWAFERAYPGQKVPAGKYIDAYMSQQQHKSQSASSVPGEWLSMGPENIGGRMLCLGFHPTDPNTIYAGSASGGLWKTITGGVGQYAWENIPLGHPAAAVSAILIDSVNPDIMVIGTGEVYGSGMAEPGWIYRYTRGFYGIGILKTTDGGQSWSHVLAFPPDSLVGVNDMEMDPNNSQRMYAATSHGFYRSLDAGDSWTMTSNMPNCFDVEINYRRDSVLYLSQGNFNLTNDPSLCGIFKSQDWGQSFTELIDAGLDSTWSGNAKIELHPSSPDSLYVSIQQIDFNTGPTTPGGIFYSNDAGLTWNNINNQNVAKYQGWYSHDIAINPNSPAEMVYVGIDSWLSTNEGQNFTQKTYWYNWVFGKVQVGVPEGGPDYVHADIHQAKFHPLVSNKLFLATDGGIFSSTDGGSTFVTHNGGLQTTQFYANMGSSFSDSTFMI